VFLPVSQNKDLLRTAACGRFDRCLRRQLPTHSNEAQKNFTI